MKQLTALPTVSQDTIFYDGNCSFCKKIMALIKRLDSTHKLKMIDLWQTQDYPEYSTLDAIELSKEIHLISSDGKLYSGYFAFKYISKILPIFWMFYLLSFIPGTTFLGQRVYKLVSDNRHLLGCSSCGKLFCRLHSAPVH